MKSVKQIANIGMDKDITPCGKGVCRRFDRVISFLTPEAPPFAGVAFFLTEDTPTFSSQQEKEAFYQVEEIQDYYFYTYLKAKKELEDFLYILSAPASDPLKAEPRQKVAKCKRYAPYVYSKNKVNHSGNPIRLAPVSVKVTEPILQIFEGKVSLLRFYTAMKQYCSGRIPNRKTTQDRDLRKVLCRKLGIKEGHFFNLTYQLKKNLFTHYDNRGNLCIKSERTLQIEVLGIDPEQSHDKDFTQIGFWVKKHQLKTLKSFRLAINLFKADKKIKTLSKARKKGNSSFKSASTISIVLNKFSLPEGPKDSVDGLVAHLNNAFSSSSFSDVLGVGRSRVSQIRNQGAKSGLVDLRHKKWKLRHPDPSLRTDAQALLQLTREVQNNISQDDFVTNLFQQPVRRDSQGYYLDFQIRSRMKISGVHLATFTTRQTKADKLAYKKQFRKRRKPNKKVVAFEKSLKEPFLFNLNPYNFYKASKAQASVDLISTPLENFSTQEKQYFYVVYQLRTQGYPKKDVHTTLRGYLKQANLIIKTNGWTTFVREVRLSQVRNTNNPKGSSKLTSSKG